MSRSPQVRATLVRRNLADPASERVRQSLTDAVAEIQALPSSAIRIVRDLRVVSGGELVIAHRLGRAPQMVWVSAVRFVHPGGTAAPGTFYDRGFIDQQGNPIDRNNIVVLVAVGFTSGGPVNLTIDVGVM